IDRGDETAGTESADALALADGKARDAGMLADNSPPGVDDGAGALRDPVGEEGAVIVVGDETDFRTVGLVVQGQSHFAGQAPDVRFLVLAYRKDQPGKLMLPKREEDVRLV